MLRKPLNTLKLPALIKIKWIKIYKNINFTTEIAISTGLYLSNIFWIVFNYDHFQLEVYLALLLAHFCTFAPAYELGFATTTNT